LTDKVLRIALLSYRGNPFCGGQGVYVGRLSREMARLGHDVEVLAGQPYPDLTDGVRLTPVPSLDLYREPDPFRIPRIREHRDWIDVLETGTMMAGGFPEPLTFSLRARRLLLAQRDRYDVVHDNQTLGYGLLGLARHRLPLVTTIHHPVQIDRELELAHATFWRRLSLRRWYGFTRMQRRTARRLTNVLTVSKSSRDHIVQHLGVHPDRIRVVPIGTDTDLFSPDPATPTVPGRIVTTASADVPLKGLRCLVEAVAKVRTERPAELVVVGSARPDGPVATLIERYGLRCVRFTGRLSTDALVHTLRSAEMVVVPSLFEGFSLPLVEAMACGIPVVATHAGALPEVAGPDGVAARLVPPGDPQAMAAVIGELLDDPAQRIRLAAAGRDRVLRNFTWQAAAERTVDSYRAAIREQSAAHGSPIGRELVKC
jgi:MMP alpha-(1->4)-mannosyltransferase